MIIIRKFARVLKKEKAPTVNRSLRERWCKTPDFVAESNIAPRVIFNNLFVCDEVRYV
jgi:hypothetical protein